MAGDVLREAFDYRFSRLDPTGDHIDPPSVAIYEPVLVKGPDWRPHGSLALRWTTSADGLEWRFQLRPGLRFHSGAVCDADAIVAAFDLLRHLGFPPDDQLWYWDPVDTVTAAGPDTLVFRLHYPYARLPSLLWGTHTAVFNEALRLQAPEQFGYELADGCGPYRLVSWSEDRVVAERWDDYPGAVAPFLVEDGRPPQRIEWSAVLDPGDRLAALESGDVHCMHGPPLDEVARLVSEGRFSVIEFPQQSNTYITVDFRQTELGFDEVRLRRAISLAVDRDALVRDVLHGHGSPSLCGVPVGDEHYDPTVDAGLRHDPGEAARMLDEMGFVVAADGVRELRAESGSRCAACARTTQCCCRWPRRFVTSSPRSGSPWSRSDRAVRAVLHSGHRGLPDDDCEVALARLAGRADRVHGDPCNPGLQLAARLLVPELDAAFEQWLRAGDDELADAAARVQSIIARELPLIPLVTVNDVWVHAPELVGYRPYKANLYPLYQPVRLAGR